MSGAPVWIAVGLALGAVVVRRRSAAILLVTLQSLVVAIGALVLTPGRSTEFFVVSFALVGRALLAGGVFLWSVSRTRQPRPVPEPLGSVPRALAAAGLALAAAELVPRFGLAAADTEHAAISLVAIGIAVVAVRRATIFQVLGIVIAENGIALASTGVHGGLPIVIELGAVFDLILTVAVATAFHERIFGEYGSADTDLLRGLRD